MAGDIGFEPIQALDVTGVKFQRVANYTNPL